jgi:hypothetical protein
MSDPILSTAYLARVLHRRHPRMSHLWEAIECPYCHAAVGEPCQRKNGGTADVSHQARIFDFLGAQP